MEALGPSVHLCACVCVCKDRGREGKISPCTALRISVRVDVSGCAQEETTCMYKEE